MGKRALKKTGRLAAILAAALLVISASACGNSGRGETGSEKSGSQGQAARETLAEGGKNQPESRGESELQSEIQKILGPQSAGTESADTESAGTKSAGTESTDTESADTESADVQNDGMATETQRKDVNKGGIEPADGQAEAVQKILIPVVTSVIVLVLAGVFILAALRRKGKKDAEEMDADRSRLPLAERQKYSGQNMTENMTEIPASFGWGDGGFAVRIGNAHHIGARENQQDSFSISDVTDRQLCRERGIFAVVADGMGGLSNGAQVSATVTSSMQSRFLSGGVEEPSIKLLEMLHYANRKVNDYLKWNPGTQSGSTVVAVLISKTSMHFISVGDSRIYLCRGKTLTQLNREHTYASDLDEKAAKGEISLEEAASDPQRKALTSYIGMGELAKIDRSIHPFQLVPGDKILLMSDGVFGTLTAREIWEAVQTDAFHGAERIEQMVLAKHRASQDNFTAVVIECVGDGQDERI